jgi:hypothetical protein
MSEQLSHTEVDGKLITKLDMPVHTLGAMSTRTKGALTYGKIITVRDLVSLTEQEFMRLPNVGKTSMLELRMLLYMQGLSFRDPYAPDGTLPLPFPSMHERLTRIEQRLNNLEGRTSVDNTGDVLRRLDSLERRAGKIT